MTFRWEWITKMIRQNEFKVGAEIGVFRGRTTFELMRRCPDLTLYAVDRWEYISPKEPKAWEIGLAGHDLEMAFRNFMRQVHRWEPRLKVIRGSSVETAETFPDGFFDFVFIDADHTYEACLADIKAWTPKVKEKGIVCGHDYGQERFPGVIQATHECFGDNVEDTQVNFVWAAKRKDYLL